MKDGLQCKRIADKNKKYRVTPEISKVIFETFSTHAPVGSGKLVT